MAKWGRREPDIEEVLDVIATMASEIRQDSQTLAAHQYRMGEVADRMDSLVARLQEPKND